MNKEEQDKFSNDLKELNQITEQILNILNSLPNTEETQNLFRKAFHCKGIKANQKFLEELKLVGVK